MTSTPPATLAQIRHAHPEAVRAEPIPEPDSRAAVALTAGEATAIRAWLAYVGEHDEEVIRAILGECQRDRGARDYYLGRGREVGEPPGGGPAL